MVSETVLIENGKSAIVSLSDSPEKEKISSEEFGHKISSLEDRYQGLRRQQEARMRDLGLEIKELSKLISKEKSDLQEVKSRKESQLRDLELRVSGQILELRDARNEYENIIESKIRDHVHRMETLELNKSSEIDIRREDQFEQVSRSLNGLTQKVDCLRKKRKDTLTRFKEELTNESESITRSVREESVRRESSVQGMRQLLDDTLNHFQTEMATSRASRVEMDRQILDQLELACQDTENRLARMISYSENKDKSSSR